MIEQIKYVKSEEACGCGVACCAMATGVEYEDVAKCFQRNFAKSGMNRKEMSKWVAEQGYSVMLKKVEYFTHKDFGREEMLKPFAPVHIVTIMGFMNSGCHAVIMTSEGNIICPSGLTELQIRDCYSIVEILGIWKD